MFDLQCTYGDFLKSDEHISTNILASRLKILEETGIISKSEHPESKAKVLYKLTQKGIDLLPVIVEISLWGGKYFNLPGKHRALQQEIIKDKAGFLKRTIIRLKKVI